MTTNNWLEGRHALVTGGGTGIGAAAATRATFGSGRLTELGVATPTSLPSLAAFFHELPEATAVLADPLFPGVLANTLFLGFGTVAVMLLFTVPIVWILARTDFPWKSLVVILLTTKIAIPGFLTAMAYVFLLSPRAGQLCSRSQRATTDHSELRRLNQC